MKKRQWCSGKNFFVPNINTLTNFIPSFLKGFYAYIKMKETTKKLTFIQFSFIINPMI